MKALQRALAVIYPHQCVLCDTQTDLPGALCPACWGETQFLTSYGCDACAAPLVGEGDGVVDLCDACLATPRPWSKGRAAFVYTGAGRRVVLGLKHADRVDLVKPAAGWMARAGRDLFHDDPLIVPVPIHWLRRVRRRYNQSAELARALGSLTGLTVWPDALERTRATDVQEHLDPDARFRNQHGSVAVAPQYETSMTGRRVVLVDDVMTSGATLTASAEALIHTGVSDVSVLTLARAVRRP